MTRACLSLCVLCLACGTDAAQPGADAPVPVADAPPPPIDARPAIDAGAGVATRAYDAQAYELTGSFDWNRRVLVAVEQITLNMVNPADTSVELDAAVDVKRVHAGAADVPWTLDPTHRTLQVDLSSLGATVARTFTVEYEVATSGSLVASSGRDADPVTARVVYTDSEPDRGVYWLVANHHPNDRASWAVELTVAADEDVISNGARVKDQTGGGGRTVRYEIDKPLPTYLMAFAAGQLEHHDRATGRVPLSIWHRRGLAVDAEAHLDVVAQAMAAFESLVGPYPWDSYTTVLLPGFPGGMENATITFNGETSGQGNVSYSLNAHELAHHWFGDWVTMRDFDDVWFKEGMATLMASEADRARRDVEGKGRRFGYDFTFSPGDAVRDSTLSSLDKYTSGPYGRAAWLITQIRVRVGETAFWQSLRALLTAHALGDIDSEGFLRSFAPALDGPTIQKLLGAIDRKPPPAIAISVTPSGADQMVSLTLTDPSGQMIAPLGITVVAADGTAVTQTLAVGAPLVVTVPSGGYLAPDEADIHPEWGYSFSVSDDYWNKLVTLYAPSAAPALAALETRSAGHQERALDDFGLPPFGAAGVAGFYAALDSRLARRSAEVQGCATLGYLAGVGGDVAGWTAAMPAIVAQPALPVFSTTYGRCGVTVGSQTFGAEIANLVDDLTPQDAARFSYLMSFDYGADASFDVISRAAQLAPSMFLREQAISRLSYQAQPGGVYSAVPPASAGAWKTFFRARLTETTSQTRFLIVWRGVVGLQDDGALALAGQKLHTVPLSSATQRRVVCDAYQIGLAHAGAWATFQQAAQPWSSLAPAASAVLADPNGCAQALHKGAPARPRPVGEAVDSPAARRAESAASM
jgi:hypothetical protein